MARDSAMTSPTDSRSRPKRCESFETSERGVPTGPEDGSPLARNDVAVGRDGHEERATLKREADAPPARGHTARSAQPHRLALEIEQLLRVHLAAHALDGLEQPPLDRREPL